MEMIMAAEFERKMKDIVEECSHTRDTEKAHRDADKLLCEVLNSLGYSAGVDIFERMGKWYG